MNEPPGARGGGTPPGEERGPEEPDRPPGEPDGPPDGPEHPELLSRLDPDRARPTDSSAAGLAGRPAAVDTRRYRWMIGIIGLVLVVIVSIYQFATHGVGSTGVAPGQRLHYFAAPLANSSLVGDANLSGPCSSAHHDPRALNVCLLAKRGPLVLSFFVAGSTDCEHQVDAVQSLSTRFARQGVQFAAVAVDASQGTTKALIRAHGWTIPVAYDRDGSVGALYGVAVCPMAELVKRGGIVTDRLIGNSWQTSAALAPRVQALLAASR